MSTKRFIVNCIVAAFFTTSLFGFVYWLTGRLMEAIFFGVFMAVDSYLLLFHDMSIFRGKLK
jgi:hypothetical protein